jgi:hypothetical protein
MNINDLTLGQLKEIAAMFPQHQQEHKLDNKMIGKYVIIRCHDAGVHAGYLESYDGRSAILTDVRRLWYWRPANKQKYLSGVATAGLHESSKVGAKVERTHFTEDCEIIQVSPTAILSIEGAKVDET